MISRSTQCICLGLSAIGLTLLPVAPASGQISRLQEKDGQFIEALQEEGMSDLLQRYAETVEQKDPINRLNTQIALGQFAATDAWNRAGQAFNNNNGEAGAALIEESRQAYKRVIDAQLQMIKENPEDERLPIWQTDLADMLLGTYLARYFNSATWYYEYGIPSAEQKQAYEESVILALEMTSDATNRLDRLVGRVGAEEGLRQELEDLGVWYKIQEQYAKLKTPLWYGHACHYASLIPREHPYYQNLGGNAYVKNQSASVAEEKNRLRDLAIVSMRGDLLENENTSNVCHLIAGSSMVRKGGRDNADMGIQQHLEPVVGEAGDQWVGFLATLSKAVGRYEGGEADIAMDILRGIDRNAYVQQDSSITSRLIAADLMHRLLMREAEKAQGGARAELIAKAYNDPYLPLINDESKPFAGVLYERWASSIGEDVDISTLPAMVRMGVGERLNQEGSYYAYQLYTISQQQPGELQNQGEMKQQALSALERSKIFNSTLTDESIADDVRARGLFNLAQTTQWLWQMDVIFNNQQSLEPWWQMAQYYATIALELPDTKQAEEAAKQAMNATQTLDYSFNVPNIQRRDIRELYTKIADQMYEFWPNNEVAHNNRVYVGAYVYEKNQEWEKAVEVYRGCPADHPTYFECQTQMMWVLRRQYRQLLDEIEVMENAPPEGMTAEEEESYARMLGQKKVDVDRVRRELLEDATLLEANAELRVSQASDPVQKFNAATAWGAARVVGALMLGDEGETDSALAKLEGYERQFSPDGPFEELIPQQPNPENAKENLNGLVRTALESRIIVLVRGDRTEEAVPVARKMMDAYPNSASAVITGVLSKIETELNKQQAILDKTVLDRVKQNAQNKISGLATLAVDLGEMMVEWATSRGLRDTQLLVYERDLAKAHLMANNPAKAAEIMKPWLEKFPNEPNLTMLGGDIHFALGKSKGKNPADYSEAKRFYGKIITAYNAQPAKPPIYWEAWYKALLIDDYTNSKFAKDIPNKVRKLQNVDPDLGGVYKEELIGLMNKRLAAGG